MRRHLIAAAIAGLALLTFFQFPGHTWLQQDTQIYAPILERLRDPSLLRNDLVAARPHVAFTLYDEVADYTVGALRLPTGASSFRIVLQFQQLVTRALGIWGIYLLAESFGLAAVPALLVAAVCSLGATIAGPAVLSFEYEPTPRAFAVPLLFCAIGLAARRRLMAAAVAGSVAFLYHPPTTIPFWLLFGPLLLIRRRWRELAVPVGAAVLLLVAAWTQGGGATEFFARLTLSDEQLQRLRSSYVWVSLWPAREIAHHVILFALAAAAFLRVRRKAAAEAALFVAGLPVIGLLSIPASWLLLEQIKWSLVPQVQPLRALLFVAVAVQFLCAVAALRATSKLEAFAWFAAAFVVPAQPLITGPWSLRALAVVAALAAACAVSRAARLPAAVAAFFLIPMAGGVVNYPRLHTPELAGLSAWARASTPKDAVFLFPDIGRGLQPGIFRGESMRAIYVDWKSGGQLNYLKGFGEQWWFRWQQTLARRFRPSDIPRYSGLGIQYIVLQPKNRLPAAPVYANDGYFVYRVP